MNRVAMRTVVCTLYETFGRKAPTESIVETAVDAVPDAADDAFAEYATNAIASLDRLPTNIGRWLSRTVYPQYVADRIVANGGSQCGATGCPECGGTGWHSVWAPDAAPGTAPTAIPCVCNRIVDAWTTGRPHKWTRGGLTDAGWSFEEPAVVAFVSRPISRDRFNTKCAGGNK